MHERSPNRFSACALSAQNNEAHDLWSAHANVALVRPLHLTSPLNQPLAITGIATDPAPRRKVKYFKPGDWYLSPRIYLAGVSGSTISYGASLERAIGNDESEDGVWGIGLSADFYSSSRDLGSGYVVNTKTIPVGVMATYHFVLDNPRIDPFIGGGIGYFIVQSSVTGSGYTGSASGSTTFFQSQLGVRYFLTDATAIGVHVGTGIGNIAFSATLRF